jgi:hypothetical protein
VSLDINPTRPGHIPPTPTDVTTGTTNSSAAAGALGGTTASRALASTVGAKGGELAGVTNANGAPSIDGLTINFSPEDLAVALAALNVKTQNAQLKTAQTGLQLSKTQMDQKTAEAKTKIDAWITSQKDADTKAAEAANQSWFTKVCNAVVGVLAAVVCLPLLLTPAAPLALMALSNGVSSVRACENLARAQETPPGDPIPTDAWDNLGAAACSKFLEATGMPAEEAEAAGLVMSSTLNVLCSPLTLVVDPSQISKIVQGAGELDVLKGITLTDAQIAAGVKKSDTTEYADQMAPINEAVMWVALATTAAVGIGMIVCTGGASAGATAALMSKNTMLAINVTNAAVQVASGAMNIVSSNTMLESETLVKDSQLAMADKKNIDAMLLKLQKQMEEGAEETKKVIDEIAAGILVVSQMINSAGASRSVVNSNIGNQPV